MGLNANLKYIFNLKEEATKKFHALWNTPRLCSPEEGRTAPLPSSGVINSEVLPQDFQGAYHQLIPS